MTLAHAPNAATRWMLVLSTCLLSSACSDDNTCGGVKADGKCYQLCDDSLCAQGNVCAFPQDKPAGICTQACQNNDQCPYGLACTEMPNALGVQGQYCLDLGLPNNGRPSSTCSQDSDCDVGHSLVCLDGSCTIVCASLYGECPDGFMCKGVAAPTDPTQPGFCVPGPADFEVEGRYGSGCPFGDMQCDSAYDFVCLGPQSTADAYCSKLNGCEKDTDCPSGYWCGAVRTFDDDNIDFTNIDFTNQPRACLQIGFCHPCTTDVECGHNHGYICVPDARGERFCSPTCEVGTNSCAIGATCEDVGGGRAACRPDFGYCYSDNPTGCDPCRIDTDCGENAMCASGAWGYKPAVNWCATPCGPPSEFGKSTCPVAPNGEEMMCLDENMYALGGPFTADNFPNYLYNHCYAPLTVDNTSLFPGDPPNNYCGNQKVEPGEECDDGNTNDNDGCANCRVTAECTFAILEPNGDGNPVVTPTPNHISSSSEARDPALPYVVSTSICKTFKVEGAIETAGDIDVIAVMLPNSASMFVSTYMSTPGSCSGDLVMEARAWKNGFTTNDPSLLDLDIPCEELSDAIENAASAGTTCPGSPSHLACGTCAEAGWCGVCDDDSGHGDCTRMLVSTTTVYANSYPVYFDGMLKVLRVYAKDPSVTVGNYSVVGTRFVPSATIGPYTPVVLSCY